MELKNPKILKYQIVDILMQKDFQRISSQKILELSKVVLIGIEKYVNKKTHEKTCLPDLRNV
jgi:chemotaxis regulatin CheY-phosphate phosphatase CheZ